MVDELAIAHNAAQAVKLSKLDNQTAVFHNLLSLKPKITIKVQGETLSYSPATSGNMVVNRSSHVTIEY